MAAGSIGPRAPWSPLPSAPPTVSLLSSALVVPDAELPRGWENGLEWQPEKGGLDTTGDYPYWWVCPEGAGATAEATVSGGIKKTYAQPSLRRVRPVVAHTGDKSSTFQEFGPDKADGSPEGRRERARHVLEANLSRIVENELWTGTRATAAGFPNDFLANAPTALNGGAATGIVPALSELEQAVAEHDETGVGMIHAQPRVVTAWRTLQLVEPDASGKRLRTILGTLVVPGGGYPGSGTGLAAGTVTSSWAYATGMVRVALGAEQLVPNDDAEATNRDVDDVTYRAERNFAVAWEGNTKHAVKVNLASTY